MATILVVDDEPDLLALIQVNLEFGRPSRPHGHQTGGAALELVGRRRARRDAPRTSAMAR